MQDVVETPVKEEQLLTIPVKKVDVFEREKMRKEAIQNTKFQKQFMEEQNKLMVEQNKRAKLQVEEQELSARSWKAWYDKMFFSMECEKIEPVYKEYQERIKARVEEEKAKEEAKNKAFGEEKAVTVDNLQTVESNLNTEPIED